ncbi:hypothetical protein [Marinoscillum luteum]|jgi:hypothetical protein|uniref:CDP-glycerol--glycerophosphate glycerophosphotransferase n=1 Tax=Marinoscillum luteum TaxID=861051 RepID=A0ABW7NDJ9_9BACT
MRSILSRFDNGASIFTRIITLFIVAITYKWFGFIFERLFSKRFKLCLKYSCIVFSPNQLRVAEWCETVGIELSVISIGQFKSPYNHINHRQLMLLALCNSTVLLRHVFKSFRDGLYRDNFMRLVKLSGIDLILQKVDFAQLLFNFNDHSPANILYYDYGKLNNKKVVYIQHAPVSIHFPPLFHDLNVLFSQDSIDKYRNPNNRKIFELFDFHFTEMEGHKRPEENKVLICTNPLDSLEEIKKLIVLLIHSGYSVLYRPHPRDTRELNFKYAKLRCSIDRNPQNDIASCIAMITNESAVILDSIFQNKPTYKAAFLSKDVRDNYGFLAKGLVIREFENPESLLDSLMNLEKCYNRQKLDYFIGAIQNRNKIVNKFKRVLLGL